MDREATIRKFRIVRMEGRRQYKEAMGKVETIKQLEKAAKLLPEKRKGRKK